MIKEIEVKHGGGILAVAVDHPSSYDLA